MSFLKHIYLTIGLRWYARGTGMSLVDCWKIMDEGKR